MLLVVLFVSRTCGGTGPLLSPWATQRVSSVSLGSVIQCGRSAHQNAFAPQRSVFTWLCTLYSCALGVHHMRRLIVSLLATGLFVLALPLGAQPAEPDVARRGCCSHHKGVCGCQGGRAACCDGTLSPTCGCD